MTIQMEKFILEMLYMNGFAVIIYTSSSVINRNLDFIKEDSCVLFLPEHKLIRKDSLLIQITKIVLSKQIKRTRKSLSAFQESKQIKKTNRGYIPSGRHKQNANIRDISCRLDKTNSVECSTCSINYLSVADNKNSNLMGDKLLVLCAALLMFVGECVVRTHHPVVNEVIQEYDEIRFSLWHRVRTTYNPKFTFFIITNKVKYNNKKFIGIFGFWIPSIGYLILDYLPSKTWIHQFKIQNGTNLPPDQGMMKKL
ncbi:hypothetical protein RFI_04295, partial [Reticulomyxa filosa]